MQELSARDISTIIKSCRDSGVKSLDYGGLKLSFEGETSDPHEHAVLDEPQDSQPHLLEQQIEEDTDLRELELQNLMISDPVAYEKHMRYEDETS